MKLLSSGWILARRFHPASAAPIGPGTWSANSSGAMISGQKKRMRLAIGHRPTVSCHPQNSAWSCAMWRTNPSWVPAATTSSPGGTSDPLTSSMRMPRRVEPPVVSSAMAMIVWSITSGNRW